jgi:hypothetical protein
MVEEFCINVDKSELDSFEAIEKIRKHLRKL